MKSSEWYTPTNIIEAARRTMEGIDLDPASCLEANTVVRAQGIFNREADGLSRGWWGKVWLNPPFVAGLCSAFVRKTLYEYGIGNVSQACVLFPVSMHTKWVPEVLEQFDAFCWIEERVHFWGGEKDIGFPSPCLVGYVGPDTGKFSVEFSTLGPVFVAYE